MGQGGFQSQVKWLEFALSSRSRLDQESILGVHLAVGLAECRGLAYGPEM